MGSDLETQVWDALRTIRYPGMSRDIVSFGFVRGVAVDGPKASVGLEMSTHNSDAAEQVRKAVEAAVGQLAGIEEVGVELNVARPAGREGAQKKVARDPQLVPGVRNIVAVASGKGGVGKSTVASNLAVSMARMGRKVGLLDADIYGPSQPTMFGVHGRPRVEGQKMLPFESHGVQLMSLGFLVQMDTPVIWRGPMVMRALEQMLGDVAWGELDDLILDLPPGTGDAQLTLTQRVPLSGAVIVTTPQDVALIDARKGLAMFRKVNVPVIGIIENMSGFSCPCCGEVTDVFKRGGGERTAELLETAFLGKIPLDPAIVEGGDSGVPIVVSEPEGAHAAAFTAVAQAVVDEVARRSPPKLEIV